MIARTLLQHQRLSFSTATAAADKVYDAVIIGGGVAGYVAAIKAGQLGLKTACVESRGSLGGTCLNVGCIPSKALLNSTLHYYEAKNNFSKHGVIVKDVSIDIQAMLKNKEKIVTSLTKGIETVLFKKAKVDYHQGFGEIVSPTEVTVKLNAGSAPIALKTKNIIIATGSEPTPLPPAPVDNKVKRIMDSTGALDLTEIPEHLVVIGAGVIGLEMGSVWGRLGAKVTVVEFLDRITPGIDLEIAKAFQASLTKQKFDFKLSTKVVGTEVHATGVRVKTLPAKGEGKEEIIEASHVLVATGRRAFTKGVGLEKLGIKTNKQGFIEVNEKFQTNVPGIYAVGDCTPGPMLAHKAEEEGFALAEILAGKHGHVNYDAIPGVIYTHPEQASVGKTEEQLKEAGIAYNKGVFPMMANSRARANADTEGMVKILSDKTTDRVLGVHILASAAGEMIAEAVLALEYGASSEDIARTCHAHPTLSEAFKEAAMATYSKPIHM